MRNETRAKLCIFIVCMCIVFAISSETTEKDRSSNKTMTHITDGHKETNSKCYLTCPDDYGKCKHKESWKCDLEAAIEIINNAKINFPTSSSSNDRLPEILDCSDLLVKGHRSSGVYTIWPISGLTENRPIRVYCDMETDGGGWTIIQRRNSSKNYPEYFKKDWKSYKKGFGQIEDEFWLGNDNIFFLTSQKLYSARFDIVDSRRRRIYAHYGSFWIDDEDNNYELHISSYSGDAGDSISEYHQHNQGFSTGNRDNRKDKQFCSQKIKGGWWYDKCDVVALNDIYASWKKITYISEEVKWSEIKIRPKNFNSRYLP